MRIEDLSFVIGAHRSGSFAKNAQFSGMAMQSRKGTSLTVSTITGSALEVRTDCTDGTDGKEELVFVLSVLSVLSVVKFFMFMGVAGGWDL